MCSTSTPGSSNTSKTVARCASRPSSTTPTTWAANAAATSTNSRRPKPAIKHRLLDTERVGQGCVLASLAFERIAQPTVTDDGTRAPALRFGDPRVKPWPAPSANTQHALTGITNKSLRALIAGLLDNSYTTNRASYDLTRLRRNGLIARVPGRNLYQLTDDGLTFAIFYTKVHNRVLRPLLATTAPHTPPPLRTALRTIDQHINTRFADARLPTAAA
jgi:hypothetical protein